MSDLSPEEFEKLYYGKFEPSRDYQSIKRRILNTPAKEVAREIEGLLHRVHELEQQLSNSIPIAAIRELIERLEEEESHHMLFMDERANMARGGIIALNKLLEGDNNG